ncbi:MAG TPA: TonB-dependent receptor, partial [Ignavibacteriales bacterium]|nr:TonB-dependent receptor [Ignavibacteriales bacterium]
YTTAYYSGGSGGGSGLQNGRFITPAGYPSRIADWNRMIRENDTLGASRGIMYNSVNEQWTIGAISKAIFKVSENFSTSFGVDWRTASIDHYREVRDLLGGDYYLYTGNQFDSPEQQRKGLGDKWSYDNTNEINWLGFYLQGEYTKDKITFYGMGGWSTIKFNYTDHFKKDPISGGELNLESDWINGYQFKGGSSYRFTKELNAFVNAGYVSKVPIFDNVIDDVTATKVLDYKNEKFTAFEGGLNYQMFNRTINATVNYYYTVWLDRSSSREVELSDGNTGVSFISGIDTRHTGVELELSYQPINLFKIDASASLGNWVYVDDAQFKIKDYRDVTPDSTLNFYIKDLKVGDAPQTQFTLGGTIFPVNGLSFQAIYKFYANNYSSWDPFGRESKDDRTQSWKAPNYGVLDLHLFYDLPVNLSGVTFQLFAHVFNTLDTEYIQDAVDNSSFNAYTAGGNGKHHTADDAEVYFGLPRSFNLGVSVAY